MTPAEAKDLCIEAHKGQYRRPVILHYREVKQRFNAETVNSVFEKIFEDGSKLLWNNLCEDWEYSLPYSSHPIAVADMMTTDDEKVVAYLHDVLEDCDGYGLGRKGDYSSFWLVTPGIHHSREIPLTANVYHALDLLTHEKGVPYAKYIRNITTQRLIPGLVNSHCTRLTIKVKLGDVFHNMSSNPSDRAKTKYLESMKVLLASL